MKSNFEGRPQKSEASGPWSVVSGPWSLHNTFGFWQLTFDGQPATLTQDQALFYVAYLLAAPPKEPIQAAALATQVYDHFCEHPDFRQAMFWVCTNRDDQRMASILLNKQRALEAILDRADEIDPVKTEALRELENLYQFQKIFFTQIADTSERTGEIILDALKRLLADLSKAVDVRGNPHPVLRPFGRHLLQYLFIPSLRASAQDAITFTYEPPKGITWTNWTYEPELS